MSRPHVLLVMVTFRSERFVESLGRTLVDWLEGDAGARLAVVENSGSSTTVEVLRRSTVAAADRVVVDLAPENAGFAPAVNRALDLATARWGRPDRLVLLNPDVSTTAATIVAVAGALDDPSIGVCAPLVMDGSGRSADRGVARRPWNRRRLLAEVVGRPALATLLGTPHRDVDVSTGSTDVDVAITTGAFMAVRGEVVGDGLDVRLPMYLEDQEICHRARTMGYRVVVRRTVRAEHLGGASRKSHTAMARQLRMMELAAAPSLSLMDETGHGLGQVRALVTAAGAVRLLLAVAVGATAGLVSPPRRRWAAEQVRLGRWFVAWGLRTRDPVAVGWRG